MNCDQQQHPPTSWASILAHFFSMRASRLRASSPPTSSDISFLARRAAIHLPRWGTVVSHRGGHLLSAAGGAERAARAVWIGGGAQWGLGAGVSVCWRWRDAGRAARPASHRADGKVGVVVCSTQRRRTRRRLPRPLGQPAIQQRRQGGMVVVQCRRAAALAQGNGTRAVARRNKVLQQLRPTPDKLPLAAGGVCVSASPAHLPAHGDGAGLGRAARCWNKHSPSHLGL